jgi:outer membrane murein-binding lipoprotein Lpp
MKKLSMLAVIGLMTAATLTGCSNNPSAEELKQLEDLKAEVSSLERQIQTRESEKQALLKAIAEKDAQLAQCAKDKDALKARTGN